MYRISYQPSGFCLKVRFHALLTSSMEANGVKFASFKPENSIEFDEFSRKSKFADLHQEFHRSEKKNFQIFL